MKTEILKIKGDWQEVVDDCRSTVSKPPLGHEPSAEIRKELGVDRATVYRNKKKLGM